MKKSIALILLSLAAVGASAQVAVRSESGSVAESSPSNIGNPTIIQNAAPQLATTEQQVYQHGLPVSSPGVVYATNPSEGTCANPGKAGALQTKVFGISLSGGAEMSDPCNDRADAVNLKVTGASNTAVMMRQCQQPKQAEAFEDAADLADKVTLEQRTAANTPTSVPFVKAFRCPDRLRPQHALAREGKSAQAVQASYAGPAPRGYENANMSDPAIRRRAGL